jgi:hypothetical protein
MRDAGCGLWDVGRGTWDGKSVGRLGDGKADSVGPSFSCFPFPSVIRQSALLVNTECPYVPMQIAATLRRCDVAEGLHDDGVRRA